MGVSQPTLIKVSQLTNRITKLMGESFKLHSQALVGYEDSLRVAKDQPIHAIPTKTLASVGTAY